MVDLEMTVRDGSKREAGRSGGILIGDLWLDPVRNTKKTRAFPKNLAKVVSERWGRIAVRAFHECAT